MSLYLYQNDQQTGPFSEDQISQMLRAGIVSSDTLAWKEGMVGWEALATFGTLANSPLPPVPPVRRSPLGLISFVVSLVGLAGWLVLFVAIGIAHNAGAVSKTVNVITGLFMMGGICLNFTALILGAIGVFKSKANTLAILGACLNGFQIAAIIGLVCLGLAVKHTH